jgi:hypothetical protein
MNKIVFAVLVALVVLVFSVSGFTKTQIAEVGIQSLRQRVWQKPLKTGDLVLRSVSTVPKPKENYLIHVIDVAHRPSNTVYYALVQEMYGTLKTVQTYPTHIRANLP